MVGTWGLEPQTSTVSKSWGIGPFTVALKQLDLCQSGSRPVNDHYGVSRYLISIRWSRTDAHALAIMKKST